MPDQQALFNQCIQEHADGLYRYAFRMLGCDSTARDVIQETFVVAWESIEQLEQISHRRAWLFTVLRRKMSRHWRTAERSLQPICETDEPSDEGHWIAESDQQDWLQFQIHNLPVPLREALLLVVMEQVNSQEAADLLEIPLGTLLSRVHRARQQLRGQIRAIEE